MELFESSAVKAYAMINIINDAVRVLRFMRRPKDNLPLFVFIYIHVIKYLKILIQLLSLLKLNANYNHNLHFTLKK